MLRRSFGLAFGALLVLAPASAHAFCRTTTVSIPPDFNPTAGECWTQGKPLFWRSACVSFSMQKDGTRQFPMATARALTKQGFDTWSNLSCSDGENPSIVFQEEEDVACTTVQYNRNGWPNSNAIIFRDDEWPHSDGFNTVALTTVTFNADTGEIYDADIEVNTATREFSAQEPLGSDYDYLSAITHEAGHFLGLAHSTDKQATMYALYEPGSTNIRTPKADDVQGVCTVYPSSGARETPDKGLIVGACNPEPRGGFTSECVPAGVDDKPPPGKSNQNKTCSVSAVGAGGMGGALGAAGGGAALLLGLVARGRRRRKTGERRGGELA